ncbi:MAG: delta-60 repeat domain-containing protein [Solirubrobacterales bacterium]
MLGETGTRRVKSATVVVVGLALTIAAASAWAAPGDLDPTFSGDGRLTIDFGTRFDYANAVALQQNGKLVVAGVKRRSSSGADFALARVNPNGSVDPSFSDNGLQTIAFGHQREDEAEAVAVLPNGRIIVSGFSNEQGVVARLHSNGALDTSFSRDGRASVGNLEVAAMAIQSDGRIVLVGTKIGTGFQMVAARLTPNGRLDPSFSGDGRRTISFPHGSGPDEGFDFGQGVTIQANGRIVVSGATFQTGPGELFAVARLLPGGKLDHSLGGDGRVTIAFGHQDKFGGPVTLQPDGKIVVAGAMSPDSNHPLRGASPASRRTPRPPVLQRWGTDRELWRSRHGGRLRCAGGWSPG